MEIRDREIWLICTIVAATLTLVMVMLKSSISAFFSFCAFIVALKELNFWHRKKHAVKGD